jgi:hypothetical protein
MMCEPILVSGSDHSMRVRTLCFSLIIIATAAFSQAVETRELLATAKGWVRYTLRSDWKVVQKQRKPPQATAQFTKLNPASADSTLAATLRISTFQTQWPRRVRNITNLSIQLGGVKSISGPWTVCRSGLHYLDRYYFNRTAHRDIAGAHLIVTLGWFGLP